MEDYKNNLAENLTQSAVVTEREARVLRAVNEALSRLLSQEDFEAALMAASQLVCEAIECDGMLLFDYQSLEAERIFSRMGFGIRRINDRWVSLPAEVLEIPIETQEINWRSRSMLGKNTTTMVVRYDAPPRLKAMLEKLDVGAYLSFRITIEGKTWGGVSFVSQKESIAWAEGVRHLLTPFVSSVSASMARKQAEAKLIQRQRLVETVANIMPDTLLIVDPSRKRFVYHNIRSNFLGFDFTQIENPFDFLVSRLHPEDRGGAAAFLQRLHFAFDDEVVEKHFRLQHQDGRWIHFYERAKIFRRHSNGAVHQYLAILQDISESVKARQALEQSEQKYRNFIEHSFDGIYYMRIDPPIPTALPLEEQVDWYYRHGFVEECNLSLARMYGRESTDALIGLRVIDVHGGEHFEYNRQSTVDFIKNDYLVTNSETIEFDANGNKLYILNHAVGDVHNGLLHGIWGTQQNITEQRRAEQNLIESEGILRATMNAIPDLKFRLTKDGIYKDYYESDHENIEPLVIVKELIGKHLTEVLPPQLAQTNLALVRRAIAEKKIQTNEYSFKNKNGEMRYRESRVSPINDEEVVVVVRDITEEKKTQLALREKLHELDKKNRQLSRYIESNFQLENFAYIASHDLREPVRTMHSFAQLLQRLYGAQLDEKGSQYLRFIIQSAENMNHLIEDLLTYAKISSEEVDFEILHLPQLLQDTVGSLANIVAEQRANIHFYSMPDQLLGNRTRLRQLFQNLLTNAIKFHREGISPEISISCIDHDTHWLFEFKDNGIGIPENMQESIFQLFRKIHYHQQHQGTGIGLALCKRIVDQHGGEIWVESKVSEGSAFYFTIKKQLP